MSEQALRAPRAVTRSWIFWAFVCFAAVGVAFLLTTHPQHVLGYVPYVLLLLCPLLHLFGQRRHAGHGRP